MPKTEQIRLRLSADLVLALKEGARVCGVSVSEYVVEHMRKHFATFEPSSAEAASSEFMAQRAIIELRIVERQMTQVVLWYRAVEHAEAKVEYVRRQHGPRKIARMLQAKSDRIATMRDREVERITKEIPDDEPALELPETRQEVSRSPRCEKCGAPMVYGVAIHLGSHPECRPMPT